MSDMIRSLIEENVPWFLDVNSCSRFDLEFSTDETLRVHVGVQTKYPEVRRGSSRDSTIFAESRPRFAECALQAVVIEFPTVWAFRCILASISRRDAEIIGQRDTCGYGFYRRDDQSEMLRAVATDRSPHLASYVVASGDDLLVEVISDAWEWKVESG